MLRMPLAGWVELLLPRTEIPQCQASVTGDERSNLLVFHYQQLHYHHVQRVFNAGMLVNLSSHGHQGQDIVLLKGRTWKLV